MKCYNCSYEDSRDFNFCPQCGYPSRYIKCERCGNLNKVTAKFCSNCGVPLPTIIKIVRENEA
ncbi:zinc ribbon domain-containing protein [Sulfuracidifex tepidarius]|uniref:Twin-arginine translocation protein TatA n=2 Tax=Sulfuracidifex tepidarius TaxID=1294262 RepID=A0A510E4W8_9CREN|nr:zinc ribbon domain-containing protein [Sulfuracidifex tepidarius]BBG24341.1 Twin-arginine translocation protein TatA [Sulfuracidifex tepidarius]BBG27098.1 Twin-arginine translocation protein TatA [Sulfuracidifex tepidarius]